MKSKYSTSFHLTRIADPRETSSPSFSANFPGFRIDLDRLYQVEILFLRVADTLETVPAITLRTRGTSERRPRRVWTNAVSWSLS